MCIAVKIVARYSSAWTRHSGHVVCDIELENCTDSIKTVVQETARMASLPAGRRGILSAYLWRMFLRLADASRPVTNTDVCYNKACAGAYLSQQDFKKDLSKTQKSISEWILEIYLPKDYCQMSCKAGIYPYNRWADPESLKARNVSGTAIHTSVYIAYK